ncbi:MAG: cytochrome c-type biogenesis protein CcmH [Gammaproteobacteria bacterium]|jgi:cytochrome c-type biogenesis protein CcmH|nr:cytochrome c-type biogenesis protein CcmH [Gammaproteobacteria bacterium]
MKTSLRRVVCAVLAVWIVGVASVPAAFAIDPVEMSDPVLQERYRALTHELRCMQCQNQSIADSPVGLAGDLRREVRELLSAGKTDDEVREYMRARYGDFILFRPRMVAQTLWLWLAPVLLMLLGLFAAWRVVQRRRALVTDDGFDDEGGDR